ncbi:MAG: penicillin acylase family protein [Cyanosarcina radialis HA8281-LM2]|jgi:penicillin amidase|nr:penicillin acylase family protein [Cyanosarcina radialis HA8281-LM2]
MGKRRVRRLWKIAIVTIALLALLLTGFGIYTVRRSFPQASGSIALPGLQAEVTVKRDRVGIPQIYASNTRDLFLAQGYVHAQDRFWQMDFWRHIGSGRLSEMFGKGQVDKDKFLRTMGWARVAKQELAQFDPQMQANLQAYADGVNAYLQDRQGSALSLEYAVLKLLNPSYQPEPWQPLHSLTWGKVMAYDLGKNLDREIERTILLKTLTPEEVEELYPPYPAGSPVIVSDVGEGEGERSRGAGEAGKAGEQGGKIRENFSTQHSTLNTQHSRRAIASSLESIARPMTAMRELLGSTGEGIGSNNWVISGKRTTTGKPLLANDPHLGVQMPSIWYEIGLHCTSQTEKCPYNVTGFSFAGVPGVVVGHNDRIAWGVTNVGADVMDLFVEKINPKNPNQYEFNGKWVDMGLVSETIEVAGGKSIVQTVRYTRHGPILSDAYPPLQQFQGQKRVEVPSKYAIALRWTALEPSRLLYAIDGMNLAQNWQEFRAAVKNFDVPSQNMVYADVDGNIGYQMPGKIPIRNEGNGRYPVPGWTDKYEWQGYIDYDRLPKSFNPPEGYIATANNRVISDDYPYVLTTDWTYGYRAQRIVEMITRQTQPISLADVQRMQGDNRNLNAQLLVPLLQAVVLKEPQWASARQLFQNWDLQLDMDDPAAALFEVFWKHLLADTFHDRLPKEYLPGGGDRWYTVINNLVQQPNSNWWDDRNTPQIEDRDRIFRQAFTEAVAELERTQGQDPKNWRWGNLHQVSFRNATLGKSGIAPIEGLFNRGGFPTAGNGETVNANRWRADKSFEVSDIPSLRAIFDLANLDNSVAIHAPGQSGHAFHPHYADAIDPWRQVKSYPMASNAVATLKLMPK